MRIIALLVIVFFVQQSYAQQYYAEYDFVRKMNLFGKPKVDSSTLDVLQFSDTSNVQSDEVYISGTVRSYSNDTLNMLELTIERSSNEEMIAPGKKIHCLIKYNQKQLVDKERGMIKEYKIPDLSGLAAKGNSYSMTKNDTLNSHSFYWNEEDYEIFSKKTIPKQIRGTILSDDNSYGIHLLRTSDRLYQLRSFKSIDKATLLEKIKLFEDCCTEQEESDLQLML